MKKDNLKRDINFFEAIFKDKTKKTRDMEKDIKTSIKIFVGVACAVIVILGGKAGITMISTSAMLSENENLASPEKIAEIEQNKTKAESLRVQNEMLDAKIKEFNGITKLTMANLADVAYYQPSGIVIKSVSYEEGELKLSCQGTDELIGAYFAQSLRNSGKFDNVIYTGASKSEANVYTAEVTIILPKAETADANGEGSAQ